MSSKKNSQRLSKHFDHRLTATQTVSLEKLCRVIAQTTTHLVFLPEPRLDLHDYGLKPMLARSTAEQVNQAIQVSIPILNGKTLQWPLKLAADNPPLSVIALKLGTGGRINHCHLQLSFFEKQQDRQTLIATTQFDGTTAQQDNQWADFKLERPLLPGHYICQLTSPDADNQNNTLFLWLTSEHPVLPDTLIDLYPYSLMPAMCLSPTANPVIVTKLPLLRGKILQWQIDLEADSQTITRVFLKLGTGGRINQCQLVLSLFAQHTDTIELFAVASLKGATVIDGQWTEFVLDQPILPGRYFCQLHSPDADNQKNILFVWLIKEIIKDKLSHYSYVSPSTRKLKSALLKKPLPLISVIITMPINEAGLELYLQAALNSVVQQIYPHWELCLITDTHQTWLETYCRRYPDQIKLAYSQPEQSLASQINTALALATGDYTVFLWPDDVLSEDALLEIAKKINQAAQPIDMLYSDEDQMNDLEFFHKPYFKPAWAPEMVYGQLYTGQLSVYRTRLLKEIGGMRETWHPQPLGEWAAKLLKNQINRGQWLNFIKQINLFYKAQHELHLWDMVLRFTEQTQRIEHIPKILYHRRRQAPIAINPAKTLEIVQQALDREGLGGRVTPNPLVAQTHILHYPVQKQPLVSIIIPTKDMAAMLAHCIESIRTLTTYPNWEIIIVDNGSTNAITFALFEKYQAELGQAFTVSRHDIPFNFSKLVNHGVKAANGDIILLLNNDTTVLGPPNWLQEMIGFAQHPKIAAVGCKLLYPEDNTIQHAGLICGLGGIANHGHKHFPANSPGYFNRLAIVSNYSAITGACLMIKRTLWEQINGFDEQLAIAFNDVDFCLKLLNKGLRHVVLPHVTFYHHESKSRGLENTAAKKNRLRQEEAYMKQRWGAILQKDPFYNPHLTKQAEDFRLASDSIYYSQARKKWWKLWW
ncbi:MAG: hypothetical protein DRR16_00825 [Candidatus Parabeggiatoa sp. nov. 3]|nr:MAG: hypothetical protein DRQ99_01180 [Gammaproteobacteria bacterium]RKZ90017.1 MAG: hypothetical protein DRR16_00825 [Gammaproteobacteria bacterium]HEW98520.1 glycosyltransferase [Beggiatoa sp.]